VLAVAFVLRVWGLRHGLPFAYNVDEGGHFVPRAIGFFSGNYNPEYFVNPPAYTYVLHVVYAIWFGGRDAASEAFVVDPAAVFAVGRATTLVLSLLGLAALFAAARRLFDERVALVATAIMAVGFLPVFYSKLALNDVPTLLPVAISLYGTAGLVAADGRRRDWVYAGLGAGLAIAFKYTAGIVLVPLLAVAVYRLRESRRTATGRERRPRPWAQRRALLGGLAAAGGATVAGFAAANPFALVDLGHFWADLNRQSEAAGEISKLGLAQKSGHLYYLWTITWGLGWGIALAAVVGGWLVWRDRLRWLVLVPAPLLFILYMGDQLRYFGRWLMPVMPLIAILAALAAVWSWDRGRDWGLRLGVQWALGTLLAIVLFAQGLAHSVHSGIVLSRDDTRGLLRNWMVENVPTSSRVALEPIVTNAYLRDPRGQPNEWSLVGRRWFKFPNGKSSYDRNGLPLVGPALRLGPGNWGRYVNPGLLKAYVSTGFCYVVIGSSQFGRAFAEPDSAPEAIRYYRRLEHLGTPIFSALPYERQAQAGFNFDWTFDYYPLAYRRPGPEVFVYKLPDARCGGPAKRPKGVEGLDVRAWLEGA